MSTFYLGTIYALLSLPLLVAAVQTECPWDPISLALGSAGARCAVPVDDATPLDFFRKTDAPWTHIPYCATSLATGTEKLCVYSSSAYNGGSGISLVVTPEIAASVAGAIHNHLPAWHSRRHLAHQGRLGAEEVDLPYTVVPVLGKGLGVIATRHIKQLETIMTSFPAMVLDNGLFGPGNEEEPAEGARLLQKALTQLTDQERFLGLARTKGPHGHVVSDVTRTNAFEITVGGRDMKGVYPEVARLNHGCDANAYPRFTKRDLAMSVVATRDIEPGEEITISYIPQGMPTIHRKRALDKWGFNCACDLCSASAEAQEASDQRRERLVEMYYAMQDETTSYDTLVHLTHEFIEMARAEGLLARFAEYYQSFMRFYYSFGDIASARKHGATSLKYAEIFSDPEGELCAGIRRDLRQMDEMLKRKERRAES